MLIPFVNFIFINHSIVEMFLDISQNNLKNYDDQYFKDLK